MNRREFVAGTALALACATSTRAQQTPNSAPGVHDLMPDFWRVYDALPSGPPQVRATILVQQFVTPNAEVYRAMGFGRYRGALDTRRVAGWLPQFEPSAPDVRQLSDAFPAAWSAHQARFQKAFPDYAPGAPVYVLPSFFGFNVHSELWNGTDTLFVAPDGVVHLQSSDADLNVLLDNGAFNLLLQQVNPTFARVPALWSRLWREGLAAYVSQQLNPGAPDDAVLMDGGRLSDLPPSELSAVAAEMLRNLNSTSPLLAARYFDLGYQGDIPARSGYLVALKVAAQIGQGRPLADLARLPPAQVYSLIPTQLSLIAHG